MRIKDVKVYKVECKGKVARVLLQIEISEPDQIFSEYCSIRQEIDRLDVESLRLAERVACRHGGTWSGTYFDGHVQMRKGIFKKKLIKVWDDELSPKIAELIRRKSGLWAKLNALESQIIKKVLLTLQNL